MLSVGLLPSKTLTPKFQTIITFTNRSMSISSLKIPWRKDPILDSTIDRDKPFLLCSRIIREILNSPNHRLPLRYLEKRRHRLRLPFRSKTFLSRYPNLLSLYPDRLSPSSPPVPFLRPSPRLLSFLSSQSHLSSLLEPLALSKLCKLLMISRHRSIPSHKLLSVKRDFALPDDFLVSLVPRHPHLLRLSSNHHLELVSWPQEYARSAIEIRSDDNSRAAGVCLRPNFIVNLPKGFYLCREMREWTRDWLELPYISPYEDASGLHPASPEMEKRNVAVLHEMLSLSVVRRMAVPVVGKFCEEFRLSNEFGKTFGRHPGIFYVSLKGGVKTAVLREAYDERGELVDRDPFLEVREGFVEMVEEGRREGIESARMKREAMRKDLELMARRNSDEMDVGEEDETCAGEMIQCILCFS